MNLIQRHTLPIRPLPGRGIQLVAGKENAASPSDAVTMGFAHYSVDYGPMSPHRHAEEIVFVLDSDRSYVRHGGFGDQPDARRLLAAVFASGQVHLHRVAWGEEDREIREVGQPCETQHGMPQSCVGRGVGEIAGSREFEAACHRVAVNLRDHGLG